MSSFLPAGASGAEVSKYLKPASESHEGKYGVFKWLKVKKAEHLKYNASATKDRHLLRWFPWFPPFRVV